jgi:hypothetical protein
MSEINEDEAAEMLTDMGFQIVQHDPNQMMYYWDMPNGNTSVKCFTLDAALHLVKQYPDSYINGILRYSN